MAALIEVRDPHNRASISRLETVAQNLPDEGWIVNGGGEVADRDPNDVADWVNLGGKWIDYCGYPMYYRQDALANMWLGSNGFRRFLMRLNNLGFDHTFFADDYGFTFDRSLVVLEPGGVTHIQPDLTAEHTEDIFSVFAIRGVNSAGWYFYAYGNGVWGIDAYKYLNFIRRITSLPPIVDPNLGKFPWLIYGAAAVGGYLAFKMITGSEKNER